MASPIAFPSMTTHINLPLLFAGQAQKEPFINHAFSAIDALLAGVVDDSLATAPADPIEGSRYRILANATGEWAGHDAEIAIRIGGAWTFITPHQGMSVFDATARTTYFFASDWVAASEPQAPTGGSVVDSEARATLSLLIDALKTAGIFANPE